MKPTVILARLRQLALAAALPALAAGLPGCTTQQLYATGQGWQKQECRKLPDSAERARCENSAAMSFERYQAAQRAAQSPAPAPP